MQEVIGGPSLLFITIKNQGHSHKPVAGLSTKALVVMATLWSLLNKLVAGIMSLVIVSKKSRRR
jgi:hypothetical protein